MILTKIIKYSVPLIIIIFIKKLRSCLNQNKLFDGHDSLFKQEIKKIDIYGEYGCGKSTSWVLNNTSAMVIAVDTSNNWVKSVKTKNKKNIKRLNIHHSDLGKVGRWGLPLSYCKMENFSDYTNYIWSLKKKPNLVLIDGRFRVCCFLTSLKFADEWTKIIFDDYNNNPHYHFVEKYVTPVKTNGRQSLFVVPQKSQINLPELNKDISAFRNVFD
jgi:hypothetical protein